MEFGVPIEPGCQKPAPLPVARQAEVAPGKHPRHADDTRLRGEDGPRIIYANRAWTDMTGYDQSEIAGHTPRILQGPASDRKVLRRLRDDLEARRIFHGQTWNYRKNGEPFVMNWFCYAVYRDDGNPLCYVAEQRDVTEIEGLRMRERLARNPFDAGARDFLAVIQDYKQRDPVA